MSKNHKSGNEVGVTRDEFMDFMKQIFPPVTEQELAEMSKSNKSTVKGRKGKSK